MKGRSPTFTQVPLDIVGSTVFGRYPKISIEQTFNMIISDGFLVPYAGHIIVAFLVEALQGRAIFTSVRYNHLFLVIGNEFYSVSTDLTTTLINSTTIQTFEGDVFIDENNNSQIAICDLTNIYIYNWSKPADGLVIAKTASNTALDFTPGYISYQNGRFIAAATGTSSWRLSKTGDGTLWPNDSFHVGALQTKPDNVVAAQRVPGRGNLLYVFGKTITEIWQDVGANLFPYQKNSSVNIDYGCLNPATIAFNDNIVIWLAANEKSGPMIAYTTGGDINKISTDGIDFKLATLTNPSNSYGFLFRQDGHLLYQITFPDDNLTYTYDFNTGKFFTLTDEFLGAHIAKRVAFFNDAYYFVSFIDGNLYQTGTQFTTYNGVEIPRIRICKNIRMPDASRFAINNLTFTIEQGTQQNVFIDSPLLTEDGQPILTEDGKSITVGTATTNVVTYAPLQAEDGSILLTENGQELLVATVTPTPYPVPQTVALSMSKNGGESFGSDWNKNLNPRGQYRNRLIFWNLGAANDFVPQLKFFGLSRFVAADGIVSLYQ